jgi:hypothetical protein
MVMTRKGKMERQKGLDKRKGTARSPLSSGLSPSPLRSGQSQNDDRHISPGGDP